MHQVSHSTSQQVCSLVKFIIHITRSVLILPGVPYKGHSVLERYVMLWKAVTVAVASVLLLATPGHACMRGG